MKVEYRPDIDGLRAIAVLSVVFYHYGIGSISGGFIGVDVFFVISGYLITGIIHQEIVGNSFTFAGFYERRIRRIFPALVVMLLTTLLAGICLLLPSDLLRLGAASTATVGFFANVLYWKQSGYFDSGSEYNPLLHTWSLAVEEQFYIGLPFLLILLHKFAKGWLKPVLMVTAVLSFLMCVWIQPLRPSAAFFLSPFRAWELLSGGLVAISVLPEVRSRLLRELVSACALWVLLASLWWIKVGADFPGWKAAVPVVATAVLLHTGASGETLTSKFLSLRPVVRIGLISYSLYLWHWPLIAYARYINAMQPLSDIELLVLFFGSLIMAYASYNWIEQPFRKNKTKPKALEGKSIFWGAALSMIALVALSVLIMQDGGWAERFPQQVVIADKARIPNIPYQACNGIAPNSTSLKCNVGYKEDKERIAVLWGDSHALAWAPAFDEIGRKKRIRVALAVHDSCPPLIGVNNPVSFGCSDFNKVTYDWIVRNRPDVVYLVASWVSYSLPDGQYSISDVWGRQGNAETFTPALSRTIKALSSYVSKVVLIGPTPGAPSDIADKMAFSIMGWSKAPMPRLLSEHKERSQFFWQAVQPLSSIALVVDPSPWFCDHQNCQYMSDEKLLYRDSGHLSTDGAKFVAKHFIAAEDGDRSP